MSYALLFWILYIISVFFSVWNASPNFRAWAGGSLVQFILIGILGLAVFGAAVHR